MNYRPLFICKTDSYYTSNSTVSDRSRIRHWLKTQMLSLAKLCLTSSPPEVEHHLW